MSFNNFKQLNADAQEGSATNEGAETAAVTNVPVEAPAAEKAPYVARVVTAHDDFDFLAREFVRAHSITSPGCSNFDCIVDVVVKEIK
jgi:hypothetical protein